jgi:hypothetical protein
MVVSPVPILRKPGRPPALDQVQPEASPSRREQDLSPRTGNRQRSIAPPERRSPGGPHPGSWRPVARSDGVEKRLFLQPSPLPRHQPRIARPQPVSTINVPQPGLSEGSATVVGMGHLLGYARVSTGDQQHPAATPPSRRAHRGRLLPGVHRDRQRRPHRPLHPSSSSWTSSARRHPGGPETGPAGPVTAPPGRQHHRARRVRHRVPQPAGGDRHHYPGGKLVFHLFAALAEFERDLIQERTSAGLAAARARGRRGGGRR